MDDRTQDIVAKSREILGKLAQRKSAEKPKHNAGRQHLSEVSVIECFYGVEATRIEATLRAAVQMLKQRSSMRDFIFVEAQKSEEHAVFRWTQMLGAEYVFVKLSDEQDFIHLKTALWNIGAQHAQTDKLLFVDSDIAFTNETWTDDAEAALDRYDVMSLSQHIQNEHDTEVQTSVGHASQLSPGLDLMQLRAHVGLSIGMTKDAYERMGRFNAFTSNDDVWIWGKILGCREHCKWMPYAMPAETKHGLPLAVGSIEGTCTHFDHKQTSSFQQMAVAFASYVELDTPFSELEYDPMTPDVLPVWHSTVEAQVIKQTVINARSDAASVDDAVQMYLDASRMVRGNECRNPIVIASSFVSSFQHPSSDVVVQHAEAFRRMCEQPVAYVCFSDEISDELTQKHGIQAVKFSSKDVKYDESLHHAETRRPDIRWPESSMVLWADIDQMPVRKFSVVPGKERSFQLAFVK